MKRLLTLSAFSFLCMTLPACTGSLKPSMTEDSVLTQRPIELHTNRHIETLTTNDLTYNHLINISEEYHHHNGSPLYIVFGYDPNEKGAKTAAQNHASITKGRLGKLDIPNAIVTTTPVIGSSNRVTIGYNKITASGPSNCGNMPGLGNTQTGSYGDYGLGCTMKDMMAQQIAYPKDLEGVAGVGEHYDGGRGGNIVNRDIRAGETRDFVPSYILSELANNTAN